MKTAEEKFWSSSFGKEYISRNPFSIQDMDRLYMQRFGVSRSALNKKILGKLKIKNILEVGCNIGIQLALLQKQGFKNLYGIEIFAEAVQEAKNKTQGINIIQGSGFDIPFKANYFDLVFTSGVLIHTQPKDLKKIMNEIYRTSKKYIWGYEYYNPKHISIDYRKNKAKLWKGNFSKIYKDLFPNLKLVQSIKLKYKNGADADEMFLLKK